MRLNIKNLLFKWLLNELTQVDRLRLLVILNRHGRKTQYTKHHRLHCTDCTYMDRQEFYDVHHLNRVNQLK